MNFLIFNYLKFFFFFVNDQYNSGKLGAIKRVDELMFGIEFRDRGNFYLTNNSILRNEGENATISNRAIILYPFDIIASLCLTYTIFHKPSFEILV